MHDFELTRANRLRLARAFRENKRVDYSIDCVVEGQMGHAFVDDLGDPTVYAIVVGPFWYFSGDAHSPEGQNMLKAFPAHSLLMPSPPEWISAAQAIFAERLVAFTRYRFSAEGLTEEHLGELLENSPFRERIIPLDAANLARSALQPASYLEIEAFDSPGDFLERGFGFAAVEGDREMGVAYSSLVCSRGIEVSIYVHERYRERGVATALASRLLLECKRRGMRPNWDAANAESCKLAKKLGYVFEETYEAYYYSEE
jgi:GNAT superfamily N-acetyltransferase